LTLTDPTLRTSARFCNATSGDSRTPATRTVFDTAKPRGQRLLGTNVVFAELLRPGKEIAIKLRRGDEVMTLMPMVEPLPEVTTTPCSWVDLATAYVVAPMPAQAGGIVRAGARPRGAQGYAYTFRKGGDSAETGAAPPAGGFVTSPMVSIYGGVANSLAGVQLMALSSEASRALGVSHGILVNQVMPGTPGRAAGLLGGDILITADSVELRSVGQLQRVISRASEADRVVTLVIMRDKKREVVQLRW
jgi:hypothetical protein